MRDGQPGPEISVELVELEEEQVWRSRMPQKIQDLQASVETLDSMLNQLRSELGIGT